MILNRVFHSKQSMAIAMGMFYRCPMYMKMDMDVTTIILLVNTKMAGIVAGPRAVHAVMQRANNGKCACLLVIAANTNSIQRVNKMNLSCP